MYAVPALRAALGLGFAVKDVPAPPSRARPRSLPLIVEIAETRPTHGPSYLGRHGYHMDQPGGRRPSRRAASKSASLGDYGGEHRAGKGDTQWPGEARFNRRSAAQWDAPNKSWAGWQEASENKNGRVYEPIRPPATSKTCQRWWHTRAGTWTFGVGTDGTSSGKRETCRGRRWMQVDALSSAVGGQLGNDEQVTGWWWRQESWSVWNNEKRSDLMALMAELPE
ncbi:hypothetical protein FB451DRAFT_1194853 [Mycena latifolia]|nr:hypothetical protein FB451DRAFT_1194853 [Mycena latifolia]